MYYYLPPPHRMVLEKNGSLKLYFTISTICRFFRILPIQPYFEPVSLINLWKELFRKKQEISYLTFSGLVYGIRDRFDYIFSNFSLCNLLSKPFLISVSRNNLHRSLELQNTRISSTFRVRKLTKFYVFISPDSTPMMVKTLTAYPHKVH